MSKTTAAVLVALLCCVATVGAAWLLKPYPPAKIPKPAPPSAMELYRDCLGSIGTSPSGKAGCQEILAHDLKVRAQKLEHELKAWPEKRKDKRQHADVMRETLKDCLAAEKAGLNPDGKNSCYLTVQHVAGSYHK